MLRARSEGVQCRVYTFQSVQKSSGLLYLIGAWAYDRDSYCGSSAVLDGSVRLFARADEPALLKDGSFFYSAGINECCRILP